MRDDELARVPKSIEPWRVMEFLREIGITPEDAYETTIGVRQVTVRLFATDETGHRFLDDDGNAAEHVVSVALVGSWKKPESVTVEHTPAKSSRCRSLSQSLGDEYATRCLHLDGHPGLHENGAKRWVDTELWADETPARDEALRGTPMGGPEPEKADPWILG